MTNLSESNLRRSRFLGGLLVLVASLSTLPSRADNATTEGGPMQASTLQKPERIRARLREDLTEYLIVEPERPNESDFEWSSIARFGPGSGADPVIGDRRIASYYEFNDGHQYPFFIAKPR